MPGALEREIPKIVFHQRAVFSPGNMEVYAVPTGNLGGILSAASRQ